MRPILPFRFESIQTLQETATASTFVAADHVLGRNNVVVKSIRKGRFADDRSSLGEIFSWYRGLRHAQVAGILDAGLTPNGDLFYVRDFAPPTQLFSTRNMELLNVLLSAVEFLHAMGRVHGSIKPANVLATLKSVQLVDPWIPQPWKSPSTEEEVRFSAPEVLKGEPRTIESDLYSVGALLYRFFSGRDLFDDADLESLTARHIWASPRPLASISYVSRTIADIVENLIHKDPSQRRQAFEALKNELRVQSIAALRSPAIGMTEPLEKAERFLQSNGDRLRILVVEAPVGFGKTRYIEELRHRMALRVPHLAFSVCPTMGRSADVALAQWLLSVFKQYCSSFRDPSVRRLQALVDGSSESPEALDPERINHDFVDVLASITQKNPLTLVIEDIDRANGKVCRLIDSIVSRATRLRLCIVLTTRPGGIKPRTLQAFKNYVRSLEYISLRHLCDSDSESIASFLERDDDRRSVVRDNAGGNPLFLEEYCKSQRPGVPRVVRGTISKLLSALPRQSRRIAELLSLFEEPVTLEVLQQMAGISNADLDQHLACLRSIGFSDNSIALRHNDTRALLHSRIPNGRRTELHALCYEHLKGSAISKPPLARHAYLGGLFEVAGSLYLELAREAIQSRKFSSTARFYGLVEQCRKRSSTVPAPTIEETITLARCRGYAGDSWSARKALRPLLSREEVTSDPELLSSVYSALASPFIEPSNAERIRLLSLATACLPKESPILGHRQRTLANALLLVGRVDEAETTFAGFRVHAADDVGRGESAAVTGLILAARGKFREAAESFARNQFEGLIPSTSKINIAVWLEQSGEIRQARRIQTDGLREAKSPDLEIVCLGNLGSMETKLGNVKEAQNLFETAIAKFERLRRGELGVFPQGACYADAALHWIERGNYRNAIHCIDRLDTDSAYQLETFQLYLPQCELRLALGQFETAAAILEKTVTLGSLGGFLDVERVLIECRLKAPTEQSCSALQSALETAKRLETQYQQCRVLIALAQNLSFVGNSSQARVAATEALGLAQEKGYRLLAAKAYLRRGLAAESEVQKDSDLIQCLQEASEMSLFPLLAECSFHIGAWRYSSSDYPSARDHLFRSVSIIAQMAEGLDSASRKKYLLLPFHQDAKHLFEEATTRTREFASAFRSPLGKEELFFGGVYRLTSAIAAASDLSSIVSILTHSLRQWIPHAGMVVLEDGKNLTLQPLEEGTEEDMRQRAVNAFRKSGGRIYFSSFGKKSAQISTAWIPIPCSMLRSGIYIECANGPATLDEQEIQYLTISATIAAAALDQKVIHRSETSESPQEFSGIVGISESIRKVHVDIEVAARNSATVLIEGESGSGKELVAQAIHSRSLRAGSPFVPVDCGAFPEGLIEAELFGARRGSFTGATEDRPGLFAQADHGTIFLDEIANASLPFQTKLLRVLQEREVRKVGDTRGKRIDVRLIAATNCNLERLVEERRFRQDLLFRLKVLHIQLPPLRDRKDDIPLLANAFLDRLNVLNHTRKRFGPGTIDELLAHDYPGNVRELQNAIERAFYASDRHLIAQVPLHKQRAPGADTHGETEGRFQDLTEGQGNFWSTVRDRYKRRDISREQVLALVDRGLRSTHGNYKGVASMFKIKDNEYRRFMDFLRRNDCLLDFRPYRTTESRS